MTTGNSSAALDVHVHEICDLLFTARKCKILSEVFKLGLFDKIEETDNAVTAASLAQKLGYRKDITERLLNALVCYKFLDRRQDIDGGADIYNLTEMASQSLTTKKENLIHMLIFEHDIILDSFEKLPFILTHGADNQYYKQQEEGAPSIPRKIHLFASYMSFMVSKQLVMAKQLAGSCDFSKYTSMLDVGGGAGFIAQEFQKTYPKIKCMVFDLPTVIDEALLQYPEMNQHVTHIKGDFFADELPKSDIILLSHILHNWSPESCDTILRKVYQSLTPGGCILVAEICLNEDKVGPIGAISMDLVMLIVLSGKERTFNEYSQLLQRHGFNDVTVKYIDSNIQDLIIAFKPQ